jgi:hypothetical protein
MRARGWTGYLIILKIEHIDPFCYVISFIIPCCESSAFVNPRQPEVILRDHSCVAAKTRRVRVLSSDPPWPLHLLVVYPVLLHPDSFFHGQVYIEYHHLAILLWLLQRCLHDALVLHLQ